MCDVVAAHYNNVPETGLDERSKSRILYLRNFNNWIKSMLIGDYVIIIYKIRLMSLSVASAYNSLFHCLDEYVTKVKEAKPRGSGLKVLDMGCGKGGDLFKWRQGKITHLVAADIAATSVEQCKERYNDIKQRAQRERNFSPIFSAEFIVANCTKVNLAIIFSACDFILSCPFISSLFFKYFVQYQDRLREQYQDVTMQLDLVSCQFAFHYCFESLPQAECMMRNASECLRPGGFFFGSCPNANAIV